MGGYRHSRPDRAKAAAAAVIVHLVIGAAFLTGLVTRVAQEPERGLKTFDVPTEEPPKLEDRPPVKVEDTQDEKPSAPNLQANPTPLVAPEPRLPLPSPILAAPVAGSGNAKSAGAGLTAGPGTGAGGSGTGRGAGGGGGIGAPARLLGGNRARLSKDLLKPFPVDQGYAHLALTVAETGRVTRCSVVQGTGSPPVDDALCAVMTSQSRWAPAQDLQGRPIAVEVRYTAIWTKR